jgi:hypothetical protein
VNLSEIYASKNLVLLNCKGCYSLKKLPIFLNLKILNCDGCRELTDIPIMENLREIDCSDCNELKIIPTLPKLEHLDCSSCINLTTIEQMPKLNWINCNNCRMITSMHDSSTVLYNKVPWLDNIINIDFKDNINDLIRIQQWYRKYKKINNFIKMLTSHSFNVWYYNPFNQGGKQTIRRLQLNKI